MAYHVKNLKFNTSIQGLYLLEILDVVLPDIQPLKYLVKNVYMMKKLIFIAQASFSIICNTLKYLSLTLKNPYGNS